MEELYHGHRCRCYHTTKLLALGCLTAGANKKVETVCGVFSIADHFPLSPHQVKMQRGEGVRGVSVV